MSETPAEIVQATEQPKDLLKDSPVAENKELKGLALEDVKTYILRAAEREGATNPEAFNALIGRMKARFGAMMEAIGPDSPAMHALAHHFDKEFTTHVQEGQEHEVAMWAARSVLLNRRDDLAASVKLLEDEAFLLPLRTEVIQPGFKAPELLTTLTDEKLESEKQTLIRNQEGEIETPIHFMVNALAQHKSHAMLMDAFAPGSDVAEAIKTSLTQLLPAEEHAAVEPLMKEWLILRSERAKGIMEATRPDGKMIAGAIAEWEEQRLGDVREKKTDVAHINEEPKPEAEPKAVEPGVPEAAGRQETSVKQIPTAAVAAVEGAGRLLDDIEKGLGSVRSA